MSQASFRGNLVVNSSSGTSRAHSKAVYILVAAVPLLLGAAWVVATFGFGSFNADATGVSMVRGTRPIDGERDVLPTSFVSAYLNAGNAINPDTLNNATVKLFRSKDHENVPAIVNTSAAGDAIVLQPVKMLDTGTKYTFEVKGVKDTGGANLMPFEMSFTTSGGIATQSYSVAFEKSELLSEHEHFTALAIGPDHKLYAGTAAGSIIAHEIQPDGTLANKKIIRTMLAANHGPRLITGIRFDPNATAENLKLWVSHGQLVLGKDGQFSLEGAKDWTGKISVLSGPELSGYRDVIVNLPRS